MEAKNKGKGIMETPDEKKVRELRALVVDEDYDVRLVHRMMLNKLGVMCMTTNDGEAAFHIVVMEQFNFDLILIDKEEPVESCYDATKKLRERGFAGKIIGVGYCTDIEEIQAFMEAGLDDYIVKPLTKDILKAILDEIRSGL